MVGGAGLSWGPQFSCRNWELLENRQENSFSWHLWLQTSGCKWEVYFKAMVLHFQFLLIKVTFSLALLHGSWFCNNLQIWSQHINNQKLWRTHIWLYFICLLGTFSYESSIMGLTKIASIPSNPSVTLFWSVADGIVALGYFSFDYCGASC